MHQAGNYSKAESGHEQQEESRFLSFIVVIMTILLMLSTSSSRFSISCRRVSQIVSNEAFSSFPLLSADRDVQGCEDVLGSGVGVARVAVGGGSGRTLTSGAGGSEAVVSGLTLSFCFLA